MSHGTEFRNLKLLGNANKAYYRHYFDVFTIEYNKCNQTRKGY